MLDDESVGVRVEGRMGMMGWDGGMGKRSEEPGSGRRGVQTDGAGSMFGGSTHTHTRSY